MSRDRTEGHIMMGLLMALPIMLFTSRGLLLILDALHVHENIMGIIIPLWLGFVFYMCIKGAQSLYS